MRSSPAPGPPSWCSTKPSSWASWTPGRCSQATPWSSPARLLGPLLDAGRRVAAAQRAALGAEGTFLACNDVVSQSVPHVHLHVVPRRRGDGLRGFFWPRSRYPDDAAAAAVARQLREALEA